MNDVLKTVNTCQNDVLCNLKDGMSFLDKTPFHISYNRIPVKVERVSDTVFKMVINKGPDFVNAVDLVLPGVLPNELNAVIKSVGVSCGGFKLDSLRCEDFQTLADTHCAIFKRTITSIDGDTYLPLMLATMHNDDVCITSLRHHDIDVKIEFRKGYDFSRVHLCGNMVYIYNGVTRVKDASLQFKTTCTTVSTERVSVRDGKINVSLNLNHPVTILYAWGFDTSMVTNVKFVIDGVKSVYDGPVSFLQRKASMWFGRPITPIALTFGRKNDWCGCVNLSGVTTELVLTTRQIGSFDVHTAVVSGNGYRAAGGMMCLSFTP